MFIDEEFLKTLITYTYDPTFQLDMIQFRVSKTTEKYFATRDEQSKYLAFRQLQELTDLFAYIHDKKTVEDFYGHDFKDTEEIEDCI
jgi:hypothetical protein